MRELKLLPVLCLICGALLPTRVDLAQQAGNVIVRLESAEGPARVVGQVMERHKFRIEVDPQSETKQLLVRVELPTTGRDAWPAADVEVRDAGGQAVPVRRNGIEWHKLLIPVPASRSTYFVQVVDSPLGTPRPTTEEQRRLADQPTGLNVSLARWYDARQAALSLRFDDSHPTHLTKAIPILREYGFRGTFMINPGADEPGSRRRSNFQLHRAEWEAVAKSGICEFANHSAHHRGATGDDDMDAEIGEAARAIWKLAPGQSRLTALNLGGGTQWTTSRTLRYYLDKYHHFDASGGSLGMDDTYGNRVSVFREHLERHLAGRGWCRAHFHYIGEGLSSSEANFRAALDVVKEHEASLWIAGMADIYKYQVESRAASLSLVKSTDHRLDFRLSCPTDPEIYDQLLTIEVALRADWPADRIRVRDSLGETVAVRKAQSAGQAVLLFDVPPRTAGYTIELDSGTIFVSPDGDDANPGTESQPLHTLQGARDRVRDMDKNRTEDVVVLFRGGDYFTDETVRFGEQDSGVNGTRVIYRNGDELGSANLIGGRSVTQWKDEGAGVYSAQLDRNVYALYENDVPAVMAREPNEGYCQFESVTDFRHLRFRAADYGRFDYQGAAVRLWAHWIPAKIRIQAVDFDSRVITLGQPYAGNLQGTVWDDAWAARTPTRFYIYNSRSFLDQPGEFCVDADSHRLYYRPRRTPIQQQTIIAPTVDRLLSIDGGASGIQFEGLTCKVSDGLLEVLPSLALHSNVKGGLIHLGDAQDIVIKYCRLLNSGQNGVIVEGDIAECKIYGNLITGAMSGGVRFVGGDNRDNAIENNYVHHVGEGIYVRNSTGDVIRSNLIRDVDSNGFKSLYVQRQTVSYNDISRVGLDGTDSDGAGIYTNCTAGGPEGGHVTIDHNLVHDMPWNGYPGYPSAAIYLDMDGVYNCTVSNNIIHNIVHKFAVHVRGPNHVIRNNIIALEGPDVAPAFTVLAGYRRANVEVDAPPIHNGNYTYENNIVCTSSGAVFQIGGKVDNQTFKRVDNNVYYNRDGRYSFRQLTLEDWRRLGFDAHAQFVDPLFVDGKKRDYRLRPDSPALTLGFQEIDASQIGLKEDFPYEGGKTGP